MESEGIGTHNNVSVINKNEYSLQSVEMLHQEDIESTKLLDSGPEVRNKLEKNQNYNQLEEDRLQTKESIQLPKLQFPSDVSTVETSDQIIRNSNEGNRSVESVFKVLHDLQEQNSPEIVCGINGNLVDDGDDETCKILPSLLSSNLVDNGSAEEHVIIVSDEHDEEADETVKLNTREPMTTDGGVNSAVDISMSGCNGTVYRVKEEILTSDSSDSSDSSSSSEAEDGEVGHDKEDDDEDIEELCDKNTRGDKMKQKKFTQDCIRCKGEMGPEDLPPLEELSITIDKNVEIATVGKVSSIVGVLVIIQANLDVPPLNDNTILFSKGPIVFGQIFEVFGPVSSPWYSVRFNSPEDIKAKGIEVGMEVSCAPSHKDFTNYVFVEHLKRLKGSDASWKDDIEPPEKYIDYSDDEEERKSKMKNKAKNRKQSDGEDDNEEEEEEGHLLPGAKHPRSGRQRPVNDSTNQGHPPVPRQQRRGNNRKAENLQTEIGSFQGGQQEGFNNHKGPVNSRKYFRGNPNRHVRPISHREGMFGQSNFLSNYTEGPFGGQRIQPNHGGGPFGRPEVVPANYREGPFGGPRIPSAHQNGSFGGRVSLPQTSVFSNSSGYGLPRMTPIRPPLNARESACLPMENCKDYPGNNNVDKPGGAAPVQSLLVNNSIENHSASTPIIMDRRFVQNKQNNFSSPPPLPPGVDMHEQSVFSCPPPTSVPNTPPQTMNSVSTVCFNTDFSVPPPPLHNTPNHTLPPPLHNTPNHTLPPPHDPSNHTSPLLHGTLPPLNNTPNLHGYLGNTMPPNYVHEQNQFNSHPPSFGGPNSHLVRPFHQPPPHVFGGTPQFNGRFQRN